MPSAQSLRPPPRRPDPRASASPRPRQRRARPRPEDSRHHAARRPSGPASPRPAPWTPHAAAGTRGQQPGRGHVPSVPGPPRRGDLRELGMSSSHCGAGRPAGGDRSTSPTPPPTPSRWNAPCLHRAVPGPDDREELLDTRLEREVRHRVTALGSQPPPVGGASCHPICRSCSSGGNGSSTLLPTSSPVSTSFIAQRPAGVGSGSASHPAITFSMAAASSTRSIAGLSQRVTSSEP